MATKKVKVSTKKEPAQPLVGLIMGSQSDWETMENAAKVLRAFDVPFETKIVSAHRTPVRLVEYATTAADRGLRLIIAGAGGAAHLPGMTASMTHLPVLGVPVTTRTMDGLDSLLSIAQMPAGIPVGTLAVGTAGATNAALLAISILALQDPDMSKLLRAWREDQSGSVALAPATKAKSVKKTKAVAKPKKLKK